MEYDLRLASLRAIKTRDLLIGRYCGAPFLDNQSYSSPTEHLNSCTFIKRLPCLLRSIFLSFLVLPASLSVEPGLSTLGTNTWLPYYRAPLQIEGLNLLRDLGASGVITNCTVSSFFVSPLFSPMSTILWITTLNITIGKFISQLVPFIKEFEPLVQNLQSLASILRKVNTKLETETINNCNQFRWRWWKWRGWSSWNL